MSKKRKKSIIQADTTHCYVCNRMGTEIHHPLNGSNRKISDRMGLTVGLCYTHHRGEQGVHGKDGNDLRIELKQVAQEVYEERIGTREEFIRTFGKSWL